MLSLSTRLLLSASLVLSGFLGLTGWVLDNAFRDSAEAAVMERLQGQLYTVISGSNLKRDGTMVFPDNLPEARFSTPGSGLYAQIVSADHKQTWRSKSAVGLDIPYPIGLPRGSKQFEHLLTSVGTPVFAYTFGISWDVKGKEQAFTFSVAESRESYDNQINSFRKSLWSWLVGAAVLLLAMQATILRLSLAPLRRVADDLRAIEQGKATHLERRYPKELRGLTGNLNALIRSEREHLNRYRNTLGDLAHSLKTPLAVVQGELTNTDLNEPLRGVLSEQVDRMRQLVDYQLQKAATSGRTTLVAPVPVREIADKLVVSLQKVHVDRRIHCQVNIEPEVMFAGDKGDLLELLGNVIENAFKWCNGRIQISAESAVDREGNKRPGSIAITVEDNGPGIPEDQARAVLQRGVRADEQVAGHGIGLAIVKSIIELYEGKLTIGRSRMGGAKISIVI
jgi:two-component system sensor histidine kinase PhoQ